LIGKVALSVDEVEKDGPQSVERSIGGAVTEEGRPASPPSTEPGGFLGNLDRFFLIVTFDRSGGSGVEESVISRGTGESGRIERVVGVGGLVEVLGEEGVSVV
jgi:hypothetical protein